MNLLILSGIDIGNLGYNLSTYLRKIGVQAINASMSISAYFGRDRVDYVINNDNELLMKLLNGAEFYILRWLDPYLIESLINKGICNRKNTIIKLHGSEVRQYPSFYLGLWLNHRITYVTSNDYSISKDLGFSVQHIQQPLNIEYIENTIRSVSKEMDDDIVRFVHASSKPEMKGVDIFATHIDELSKSMKIQLRILRNLDYDKCLLEKAKCNYVFGKLFIPYLGVNELEGFVMKQPVMTALSHYVLSMYPELDKCVYRIDTNRELKEQIKEFIDMDKHDMIDNAYKYVCKYHSIEYVCKQWYNLIKHVMES